MDRVKQRIAIARALGWKHLPKDPEMIQYTAETPAGKWSLIPDYTMDLDAMHVAEKSLPTKVTQVDYAENLSRIVGRVLPFRSPGVTDFDKMHATAEQRAEAFLETLNLWIP